MEVSVCFSWSRQYLGRLGEAGTLLPLHHDMQTHPHIDNPCHPSSHVPTYARGHINKNAALGMTSVCRADAYNAVSVYLYAGPSYDHRRPNIKAAGGSIRTC